MSTVDPAGVAWNRSRPAVAWQPELAQRIRSMRAEGMTLDEICAVLNVEGVPTVRGAFLWRPSALQSILGYARPRQRRPARRKRNKAYAGWWVYWLYDHGGRIIYIGMTINVERRFAEHAEKVWWVNVGRSRLHHFPTKRAAQRVEREAIRAQRPTRNKAQSLS